MFGIRAVLLATTLSSTLYLWSQNTPAAANPVIESVPPVSEAHVGDKVKFKVVSHGATGDVEETPTAWFATPFDSAYADPSGTVSLFQPGRLTIGAVINRKPIYTHINVLPREVATIDIDPPSRPLVTGSILKLKATPRTQDGKPRRETPVDWSSQNTSVATVDAAGVLAGVSPGTATIQASAGTATGA